MGSMTFFFFSSKSSLNLSISLSMSAWCYWTQNDSFDRRDVAPGDAKKIGDCMLIMMFCWFTMLLFTVVRFYPIGLNFLDTGDTA
jgi:hypothetical protein